MSVFVLSPQQLIEQCQGLVRSLAVSIHRKLPPHIELEDLIAYGQVGLAEAARDFDPERGSRFPTYAYYRIRGAIYDGLAKMTWFNRSDYRQVRYEQMANDLLGTEVAGNPAPPERGVKDEARWFRDLSQAMTVIYLACRGIARDERVIRPLADPSTPLPPAEAMGSELHEKLNELIAALPPEELQLVRAIYFEDCTLQEAGQRLGISKSWASRLHARILHRLASSLRILGMSS